MTTFVRRRTASTSWRLEAACLALVVTGGLLAQLPVRVADHRHLSLVTTGAALTVVAALLALLTRAQWWVRALVGVNATVAVVSLLLVRHALGLGPLG